MKKFDNYVSNMRVLERAVLEIELRKNYDMF